MVLTKEYYLTGIIFNSGPTHIVVAQLPNSACIWRMHEGTNRTVEGFPKTLIVPGTSKSSVGRIRVRV